MKSSIQQELHLFAEELQRQVSTDTLEQLAKETGFVQRSSKYRGQDLVSLCVWLSQRTASAPLTKLCSELEASTGVAMSPERLNQRFNSSAVIFLQQLLSRLMKSEISSSLAFPCEYLEYFKRIRILDSTLFQIPSSLAAYYPGSGGCGQKAGVKIQLEYDLHSGQFLNLQVEPGKNNDKTFGTHCLDTLRSGDL